MTIIQNFLGLLMGEMTSEDRINTMMMNCVVSYDIMVSLVPNTTLIKMSGSNLRSLGMEIDDDISIPWIIRFDQKQCFIRDKVIDC